MTGDRRDAIVLTYRERGHARRHVFEPRDDGRWSHVEETLTESGEWRTVGEKIVESVSVETPSGE